MADTSRYVEAIFTRMLVRYGASWISKWEGVPADALKADWASQIEGFNGHAIRHALENLPADFPPTASQFRALCINRPEPATLQIPAPKADPTRVAAELARMRSMLAARKRLQWAYDLQEREKQGDALSMAQRAAWRDALRDGMDTTIVRDFTPVPVELWPPGMAEHCGRAA